MVLISRKQRKRITNLAGDHDMESSEDMSKVMVKCTLVQALRLCIGRTVHRGSRGIALTFHDHATRRG